MTKCTMTICNECGLPEELERDIIVMDSNPFSISEYLNDRCDGCGHIKSGITIKPIYKEHQKILNKVREKAIQSERERIFKILDEGIDYWNKKRDDWKFGSEEWNYCNGKIDVQDVTEKKDQNIKIFFGIVKKKKPRI